MAINNYLVIGVNPANNETSVPVDRVVNITFSKHMEQASLNSSNIVLKEINGAIVPYTMTYNAEAIVATLDPTENLKSGTQYQVQIIGAPTGVRSITGDYMSVPRNYEFTTSFAVALSHPTNLATNVDSGFVTLTWERPADYDVAQPLTYEVQISTSNDPLIAPVWPSTGDINKTNGTVLNVPKKFSEGNYYAYVRALHGDDTSDWASLQFVVEAPATVPAPTLPDTGGGGDIFSFDVVDTYPRRDDVDVSPEQIIIVFGANVDVTTVNENTVYIVKKQDKENLSLIDFMTEYSPAKKVPATIDSITTPNVVTLTATLEGDAEYTVIVRESVKNSGGTSLGTAYHWSFVTKYSRLFGDAALVRQDLGSFSSSLSDKMLYKYLSESTEFTWQIISNTAAFDATLYVDGAAPYYVHQYVRLKTAHDLLLNAQLRSGGGAMTSNIQLGDLRVEKEASSSVSINGVLSDLKERMKPLMDMIQGHHNRGYAKPIVAVRGENIAYPDFLTRTEFRDLGQ